MQDLKIGNMIIKKRGSVRKFRIVRDFFTEPAEKGMDVKTELLYFLTYFQDLDIIKIDNRRWQ